MQWAGIIGWSSVVFPPAPSADYMDLDEYIAFCRRVGAAPLVGVNLGSGRQFNRLQDSLDEARRRICDSAAGRTPEIEIAV